MPDTAPRSQSGPTAHTTSLNADASDAAGRAGYDALRNPLPAVPMTDCEACNGEGDVCRPDGTDGWEQRTCPACDGAGEVEAHDVNA